MKTEIWIPTRGWPFHGTIARLNEIGLSYQFEQGGVSVADVRNTIVWKFLSRDADVLVMVDDDVVPPTHFLEKLLDGIVHDGYDIVAGVVLVCKAHDIHRPNVYTYEKDTKMWRAAPFPEYAAGIIPAEAVGTGCIAIKRKVLQKLKAPFALEHDKHGMAVTGEDLAFCKKATSQGFKIAARYDVFCEHYDDVYANGLAQAYLKLLEVAHEGSSATA